MLTGVRVARSDGFEQLGSVQRDLHAMLCATLDLAPDRFRLIAGAAGRGTLGEAGLTALADMVPPEAPVGALPQDGGGSRFAAYRGLLSALAPETEAGLCGLLGEGWADWCRYRDAATLGIPQAALFRRWSERLPGRLRRECRAAFAEAADPLDAVRDAAGAVATRRPLLRADGRLWTAPHYRGVAALAGGTLRMRRCGAVRLEPQDPCPAGEASAATASPPPPGRAPRLAVSGAIAAVCAAPVSPGDWYDAHTVERARMAPPDRQTWDRAAPEAAWSEFFGPRSPLRSHVSHIVVAAGIDLTMTLPPLPDLATGPDSAIPFLALEGTPTALVTSATGGDGRLRVRWRLPAGTMQCLGVLTETP